MLKIDTHAHWFPPEWVDLIAKEGAANGAQVGRNERGQVGHDRVVMGSDCPADMGYTRPVDVIERLKELSAGERESILGGNAAKLLKLA